MCERIVETYTQWLDSVTTTNATFTGERKATYSFYSIATDGVGLRETAPATTGRHHNNPPQHRASARSCCYWNSFPMIIYQYIVRCGLVGGAFQLADSGAGCSHYVGFHRS